MKKLVLLTGKIALLILGSLLCVYPAAGQTIEPPYPGAKPVAADSGAEFYIFRTLSGSERNGMAIDEAKEITVKSFTTSDSFEQVFTHLCDASQERFQETSGELDPDIRSFIGSLGKDELDELAKAVGSNLTGEAYRSAFLTALDKTPAGSIQHGITKKQVGDKTLYYFDLHRPYLNFRTLRWIDATHIEVIREPFSLPAYTGLSRF